MQQAAGGQALPGLLRLARARSHGPLGSLGALSVAWQHGSSCHWLSTLSGSNDRDQKEAERPILALHSSASSRGHPTRSSLAEQLLLPVSGLGTSSLLQRIDVRSFSASPLQLKSAGGGSDQASKGASPLDSSETPSKAPAALPKAEDCDQAISTYDDLSSRLQNLSSRPSSLRTWEQMFKDVFVGIANVLVVTIKFLWSVPGRIHRFMTMPKDVWKKKKADMWATVKHEAHHYWVRACMHAWVVPRAANRRPRCCVAHAPCGHPHHGPLV